VLVASLALAVFAILLAWPVPILLSRAEWPSRAPATALLLWQAIALAGGLSMIGSLLTLGLAPFGETIRAGLVGAYWALTDVRPIAGISLLSILAIAAAVILGAQLVLNLAFTAVLTERQRRRHRSLVDLLSSPSPDRPNTRVLDSAAPVAYCLPGGAGSVTVLSQGLVSLLSEGELHAVIEHEKAHLTQRHYVVLLAFDAWRTSLPWFPIATRAQNEVGMLVEMLADDTARRSADTRELALAIALVAGVDSAKDLPGADLTGDPAGRVPPKDRERLRISRLVDGKPPLSSLARTAVIALAIALIAVPTVLLLAPSLV
jgi:Zn-dependent protease with chaperone function